MPCESLRDLLLLDFRNDAPADSFDEPAPFFLIAWIGQQRRDQRGAARGERPPRRPYMQGRYMSVPDILFMHGIE